MREDDYEKYGEEPKGLKSMPKRDKIHTGSPKPKTPVSRRTSGPAGGKGPGYGPEAAAKHLEGQDRAAPKC